MNLPIQLHVQHSGLEKGTPIVFLNSLGTDLNMWNQQVAQLSSSYRMIQMDTRGHGQSAVSRGPYSIDLLCEDVIHTLDALGVPKAYFCGISMGGMMALNLSILYPSRVEKIVAANTAAIIGNESAWLERANLVRMLGMGPVVAGAAGRWFTSQFNNDHVDQVNVMLAQLAKTPSEGYAACCEALSKADLREKVASISVPVCIVAGELDPVTTVIDGQFLVEKISSSRLEVLPASHLSNVENPQQFSEILSRFF
jgi:3-oxoadipate enol-lactonase